MTNKKQRKSENPPEKLTPAIPISDNADKIKEETKNTANATNKCDSKGHNPQPFLVKIDKSKGWSRAEIISGCGIGMSVILFVMTLVSFNKTRQAVSISEKSYNDGRVRDSIALKQFEVTNQPFFQITDMTFDSIKAGSKVSGSYILNNLSESPAQTTEQYYNIRISDHELTLDSFKYADPKRVLSYISKGFPRAFRWYSPQNITQEEIANIKFNNYFMYMARIISYKDLRNEKMRTYYVVLKMNPFNRAVEVIYNENINNQDL